MSHPAETPWKLTDQMRWKKLPEHDPKAGEWRVLQRQWVRWVKMTEDPLYKDEYEWRDVPMEEL